MATPGTETSSLCKVRQETILDEIVKLALTGFFRTTWNGSANDAPARSRGPDGSNGSGSDVRSNARSTAARGRGTNASPKYGAGWSRPRPRSQTSLAPVRHVPLWRGLTRVCGASPWWPWDPHHALTRPRARA